MTDLGATVEARQVDLNRLTAKPLWLDRGVVVA